MILQIPTPGNVFADYQVTDDRTVVFVTRFVGAGIEVFPPAAGFSDFVPMMGGAKIRMAKNGDYEIDPDGLQNVDGNTEVSVNVYYSDGEDSAGNPDASQDGGIAATYLITGQAPNEAPVVGAPAGHVVGLDYTV